MLISVQYWYVFLILIWLCFPVVLFFQFSTPTTHDSSPNTSFIVYMSCLLDAFVHNVGWIHSLHCSIHCRCEKSPSLVVRPCQTWSPSPKLWVNYPLVN
jgi:hypothetical protein